MRRGRVFSADDQNMLRNFLAPDPAKTKPIVVEEESKSSVKKPDVWSLPFANLAATAMI